MNPISFFACEKNGKTYAYPETALAETEVDATIDGEKTRIKLDTPEKIVAFFGQGTFHTLTMIPRYLGEHDDAVQLAGKVLNPKTGKIEWNSVAAARECVVQAVQAWTLVDENNAPVPVSVVSLRSKIDNSVAAVIQSLVWDACYGYAHPAFFGA